MLESLELSFDDTAGRRVAGLYGRIRGLDVLGTDELRAQLLLGLDDGPASGDTVFIAALRIDDENCSDPEGKCVDINQVLSTATVSLDLDLQIPAVNFALMVPDAGSFHTSALGPEAKTFLDLVNGSPAAEPYSISGNLNVMADVPLAAIQPLLTPLGIAAPPSLRIEGSAGFGFQFLDGGTGTLDNLELTASLGPVGASEPQGWPTWLDFPAAGSESWTFFLRFAEGDASTDTDDALELGTEVAGITSPSLFPGGPPLTLSAGFTGTVSGPSPEWTITAKAFIADWEQPFGITFLTIDNASAVLTLHQPAGGPLEASAELCGTFSIPPVTSTVCFSITSVSPPSATFSIALDEPVSLSAILTAIPGLGGVTLPTAVGSMAVGPGELAFTVTGSGEFSINAVISASFSPAGNPVGVDLMLSANFGAGTPTVAFGVQPHPGITLGQLLNLPGLPVDLPLTPEDPGAPGHAMPNTGFAFVYTSAPGFDPNSPLLPQSVRDWFLPLYGGDMTGKTLGNTAGVIGAFALPEPLGGFVETIGINRNILLSGGITLDPLAIDLSLTLRVQQGVLPDFVAGAELTMTIGLEAGPPPKLLFALQGDLYLKLKQGMDAELASQLQGLGLDLPAALPVAAGASCPRGGFNFATYDDGSDVPVHYCYDKLRVTLGTNLSVSVDPVPAVSLRLFGSITSMNAGGEFWRPLGIQEIGIGSLGAEIEIEFVATPLSLNLKLGLYGDIELFNYSMSAGIKVGATVVAAPTPIGIAVTPNFDGLRLAFPDGLATGDIINLANILGGLMTPPVVVPMPSASTFPNIGLKNLYFSISPFGAPTICIEQGLVFRGDLYINPPANLDFDGGPPCDPQLPAPPDNFPVDPAEAGSRSHPRVQRTCAAESPGTNEQSSDCRPDS